MNTRFLTRLFLLVALLAGNAAAQTFPDPDFVGVQKDPENNQITADLEFPSGRTLQIDGDLDGTPTGGVLDLSNLSTLALPSSTDFPGTLDVADEVLVGDGQDAINIYGTNGTIEWEGDTNDSFEGSLKVIDPTADNEWFLPDTSGNLTVAASITETLTGNNTTDAVTPAGLTARVLSQPNAPPRGFAISDGATTDRAEIAQPGDIGDLAGLPATFVIEDLKVPTAELAVSAHVLEIGSIATGISSTSPSNSFKVVWGSSGNLVIRSRSDLGNRDFTYTGWRGAYSGQTLRIAIAFPEGDSTTDPTVHINGEDVSSSFTSGTSGSNIPNWLDADLDTTYFLSNYNAPSGRAPCVRSFIGALSASEAANYTKGMPLAEAAPWTQFAGSAVAIYSSDFSSSSGWTLATDVAITGSVLQFTANGTDRSAYRTSSLLAPYVGKKVLISFTASSSATIRLQNSAVAGYTEEYGDSDIAVASGANALAVTITSDGSASWGIRFRNSGGSVDIDDLSIAALGLIDDPGYQPALATDDRLGRISRRLVGMTPVSWTSDITIYGDTSTSGNQQLLGGATFANTTNVVLDSIEQVTLSGTPTTTVGSASGGAQYKASGSLSAGINPVSLVTRKVASTSVWVGSNDTTRVRTIVRGHRVSTPAN